MDEGHMSDIVFSISGKSLYWEYFMCARAFGVDLPIWEDISDDERYAWCNLAARVSATVRAEASFNAQAHKPIDA